MPAQVVLGWPEAPMAVMGFIQTIQAHLTDKPVSAMAWALMARAGRAEAVPASIPLAKVRVESEERADLFTVMRSLPWCMADRAVAEVREVIAADQVAGEQAVELS